MMRLSGLVLSSGPEDDGRNVRIQEGQTYALRMFEDDAISNGDDYDASGDDDERTTGSSDDSFQLDNDQ